MLRGGPRAQRPRLQYGRAEEGVPTVRVMDGRNRQWFADQEQLLGSWISASRVLGTPRPGAVPDGDGPLTFKEGT